MRCGPTSANCASRNTLPPASASSPHRWRARGREGDTVGTYVRADLACSLYLRGKRPSEETLTLEERITRMTDNPDDFIARVTGR